MDKNLKNLIVDSNYQSPIRLRNRVIPKSQPLVKSKIVNENKDAHVSNEISTQSIIDSFNDFSISSHFSPCVISIIYQAVRHGFGI